MFEYNAAAIDASSSYDRLDNYLNILEDQYNQPYFHLRKWLDEHASLMIAPFNQANYPLNDWITVGFYHGRDVGLAAFKKLLITAFNWLVDHPDVVKHQYLPRIITTTNNPIIDQWAHQQIDQWQQYCDALIADRLAYQSNPGQYQLSQMMSTFKSIRGIYGDSIDKLLKQNHHN